MPHIPQDHAVAMRVCFQTYCNLLSFAEQVLLLAMCILKSRSMQTLSPYVFEVNIHRHKCRTVYVTVKGKLLASFRLVCMCQVQAL